MPLTEAGLDSIGAVKLRNALAQRLGADLPATITFDYPTVAAMAGYVAGQLGPAHLGVLDDAAEAYELESISASHLELVTQARPHAHHCHWIYDSEIIALVLAGDALQSCEGWLQGPDY